MILIQVHPRIKEETKRHLETIAKENNKSVNDVIADAINEYVSNYFTETQEETYLPRLEQMLADHLNDFSTHIRSLIARGVLDNAVSMLGIIDLIANETDERPQDLYQRYRELAYVRVKDRHELFKDLNTLIEFKEELDKHE